MIKTVFTACIALLMQTVVGLPPESATTGSIEGVVLRAGSDEPIAGARVTISSVASRNASCMNAISSAGLSIVSDSQGKFSFKGLVAGPFCIAAGANGYAKQIYGQRAAIGQGTAINVNAGQTVRDIVVPLTVASSIAGRIRDNLGQSAAGVQVQLLRLAYNSNGQRSFQSAGNARTDDRGEYRLYWITPGRYFVLAGTSLQGFQTAGLGSPNEIPGDILGPTYYPNAADVSQATAIEVKPASDIGGVDFRLGRQSTYRIRGRVIDSRTGQAPPSFSITSITVSPPGGSSNFTTASQSTNFLDGTFEIREGVPGLHVYRAQVSISNTVTPGNAGVVSTLALSAGTAQVAVNVTSDVDGLLLTIASPVSVPGRLTMEGQSPSGSWLDRTRVQLLPSIGGVLAPIGGPAPRTQVPSADGSFRADTVLPGEYLVQVTGMPPDVYVKQARFRDADILNSPMQFGLADSGTIEILLSPKGGQIDGTVVDEKQRAVQGTMVVLVPDQHRDRFDLYKTPVTDAVGHFNMVGVPPGDYKLFAWDGIDAYAWFDPVVLKTFEPQGKPVHVTESSKAVADLRLIPAQQ